MFADVGKRFLHDVEHLRFGLGVERAPPPSTSNSVAACLFGNMAQRSIYRAVEIPRVDARTEMHQQFAHVIVALVNAAPDQFERGTHLCVVVAADRLVKQLELDIEKSEALSDRVMQFVRQQVALVRYRQFAVTRPQTQIVDCASQLLAERLEQFAPDSPRVLACLKNRLNTPMGFADTDRCRGNL